MMSFPPPWLVSGLHWIQYSTAFPELVNRHPWMWPAGEILHFVGLCLLIGAIGVYDLRLIGMAKALPIRHLREFLPLGVIGFVICLITGVAFILGNPRAAQEFLANAAFQWKMILILLAGANVLVFFRSGLARRVEALEPGLATPLGAKLIGGTSLVLWIGVIFFGRFLPILGDAF